MTQKPPVLDQLKSAFSASPVTPSERLLDAMRVNDLSGFKKVLAQMGANVDIALKEERWAGSKCVSVWVSPLEAAVYHAMSSDMIALLLEQGAQVTAPVLEAAVHKVAIAPAGPSGQNHRTIVQLLSAFGADWSQSASALSDPDLRTGTLAQALIKRVGQDIAQDMGVRLNPQDAPGAITARVLASKGCTP